MSYSLMRDCQNCMKQSKCIDANILEGAVYAIHQAGQEKGHLGRGVISLECQNFLSNPVMESGDSAEQGQDNVKPEFEKDSAPA